MINELVFNSLKHAYPDNVKGNININTEMKDNIFILTYTDDGIGLPEEININEPHTLGFIIIKNLIEQIDGTITEKKCEGTGFEIKFKIKK
ncbi:ATP-binding protein [Methanobrevibacter sp. UBA46]|uniref:ATP-binding protein n=1 Tax=Methanobrevibacter sp. UBA46 TaxID=1915488 RepID=UPI0039B900B2